MLQPKRVKRPRRRIVDRAKLNAVMEAVSNYEIQESWAWDQLDSLSSHTYVEEIEAIPEGIFETDEGEFSAIATVYVTLNYGSTKDDLSVPDSFPAQVEGHFEIKKRGQINAIIDEFSVDTSSFYE
jgi:hypothetical protein